MAYLSNDRFDATTGLPFIGDTRRPISAGTVYGSAWDSHRPRTIGFDDARPHVRFSPSTSSRRFGDMPDMGPTAANSAQMQDQLRLYRQELAKKDQLINQLTNIGGQKNGGYNGPQVMDRPYVGDQFNVDEKFDMVQRQLRETQVQLERKEEQNRELRLQLDMAREAESRQMAEIQMLRRQLTDCESVGHGYGGLTSVGHDQKGAYDRVRDMESRFRLHMDECERAQQERLADERKLRDIVLQLRRVLYVDGDGTVGFSVPGSLEHVLIKATEVMQENTTLRARMATMQGHMESAEADQRTNRETIARMMNDQQNLSQFTLEIENLTVERDAAINRQKELLTEIEALKNQLDSTQHAWSSMRRELEEQKAQQRAIVDRENLAQATELQSRSFKECLAKMMSTDLINVEPYEEVIRERLQNLMVELQTKDKQCESYDGKLSKMAAQLDAQYELNRVADRKLKRAEADLLELEDKLRRAECGLDAHDAIRISQDRCVRLLEQVSRSLNMAPFRADASVDEMTNQVIVRGEQLCQAEMQNDRKTLVIHLQHKVKKLKEKLADKERSIAAMQRRLSSIEDRMSTTSESELERDEVFEKNRRLVSLVDKYRNELNEAHLEIRDLKSRLMAAAESQGKLEAREQEIAELQAKVNQLEFGRTNEMEKLIRSRDQLEERKDEVAAEAKSMAEEINRLTYTLDNVTKRQRELSELRQVVGRMLGMNVGPGPVADGEIVSRLEKLILANQASMAATIPVDANFQDLAKSFRQGQMFAGPQNFGAEPPPQVATKGSPSKGPVRGAGQAAVPVSTISMNASRSRSQSPVKKPDPKVY